MGTASQRSGLEDMGLRFVESEVSPLRGWTLRPNPADVDDTFEPEELETEVEDVTLAADELVHVEDPMEEIELDDEFYPVDSGAYDWELVEDLTP